MFYSVVGALLSKASSALQADGLAGDDDFAVSQRRRVVALLRRLGRIWPDLFSALQRQNIVLSDAAARARQELSRHGLVEAPTHGSDPGDGSSPAEWPDPLAIHAFLLADLDRLVVTLHTAGSSGWAREARRRLRRDLAAAADIESRLLSGAVAK